MIKYTTVQEVAHRKELKSIVCDACKKEVPANMVTDVQSFVTIRHTCGYGDFSDGDRIECDLCKECWPKILPFRLIEEGSEEF